MRMNGGGSDQLAFDIAGRFARGLVNTGYARFRSGPSHADFGPPIPRLVQPRGAWLYTGAVLLLIGRRCASSNESFIAAMQQLPNVTLVGDCTAILPGNPGTFPLANGWTYSVPAGFEYTVDGQVIEDVGLSPGVFVTATAGRFRAGARSGARVGPSSRTIECSSRELVRVGARLPDNGLDAES